MLQRVAEQLRHAATNFFGGAANPYRAHGDEFYLTGDLGEASKPQEIHETLDHVRESIARIKVPVQDHPTPMACTVSVGWLLSTDLPVVVERSVRTGLEAAVSHAKRSGRNRCVRFSDAMQKAQTASARDNCTSCGASFSFDVPSQDYRSGPMFCPNCGTELERPPAPPDAPTVPFRSA